MNVTQLKEALDDALSRGLHPETSVVIARDGWYVLLSDEVEHPVDGKGRPSPRSWTGHPEGFGGSVDLWFTLSPQLHPQFGYEVEADARLTPGHFAEPDPKLYAEWQRHLTKVDKPIEYVAWLRERIARLEEEIERLS